MPPPSPPWKAVAVGGLVLGGLGALMLLGRRSEAAPATPRRVALIGDSYAVGLGPELAKLLAGFQCQGDGFICTGASCEGHAGTNTAQWATHAKECGHCGDWLTAFKPDVVLVSLGVNDGSAPNPANYQSIVSALHGIGARVIWIEPPAGVKTPSRAIIRSLGVPTVPGTATPLASDGLHPASYGTWAQEVARAVT
jgi:hypothetical protein